MLFTSPFIVRSVATFFLALINIFANAQTPNWLWAKSAGGNFFDETAKMAVDSSGNIYIAGNFSSPFITFDNIVLSNADTNWSGKDIFITKYDPAGNVLWAVRAGGIGVENVSDITVDVYGNLIIVGSYSGQTSLIGTATLSNTSTYNDVFISKYGASGNFIWAKSAGGNENDESGGISTDTTGNIFISGHFSSATMTFGNLSITNATSNGTDRDIFVARYDSNGNAMWAKNFGAERSEYCNSVSTDANGNVYITGLFQSQLLFFGNSTLSLSNPILDVFVAKYDALGNELWAKTSEGPQSLASGIGYIATDVAGNTIITGSYSSTLIAFGVHTLTLHGTPANSVDVYVVKYDAAGNVLWAKGFGGNAQDYSADIVTDTGGNIYLTGFFRSSSIAFDNLGIQNTSTESDIFITKYNSSGNVIWVKSAGGDGSDAGRAICADKTGNIYVSGIFYSHTNSFGNTLLTNSDGIGNTADIFIAKLNGGYDVGLLRQNYPASVLIFPNPFSSQTILRTDPFLENATLVIENSLGQKVKQIDHISGRDIVLSKDDLCQGIYFIRIMQGGKVIVKEKIIISG
jgi:hypothetical protein